MVFYEEQSGKSHVLNFSSFPAPLAMQQWMAALVATRCGARGGSKRLATAKRYHWTLHRFMTVLSEADRVPSMPSELAPAHFQIFRDQYEDHPTTLRTYLMSLRRLMRASEELTEEARRDLLRTRLPTAVPETRVVAYSDDEWQQIMTALRRDVRTSRDRIRAGARLLERSRGGELTPGSKEEALGRMLEEFAATGDLPRNASGALRDEVARLGGAMAITGMLSLTRDECTAFALLLSALTAENFGTVKAWPAVHTRPDGGVAPQAVALVEETKPRRGPDREHMIAALEDLPASLCNLVDSEDIERRLFHSPLRVYQLLLELTQTARRLSNETSAFISYSPKRRGAFARDMWNAEVHVKHWSQTRGFPSLRKAIAGGRPAVQVRRIRQTALELKRRPTAHSRETLRDHYLKRSRTVQEQSRSVVGKALRGQVTKARAAMDIPVFTPDFIARATRNLEEAAVEAGLDAETLKRLLTGEQDTVLAGCVDHLSGPETPPGMSCTASFFACLQCENARALPHQLPVQIAARDRLLATRPNADPATWRAKYQTAVDRLEDILRHYTPAEREQAHAKLTDRQSALIDDLLSGRLDLR
ncbi:hypothetical protein [Streptomyces himastatinicus]|uniref:hypothetical protein n=1 Tax=Streptomyces himastatinicus TaxID=998084 RepID=UPI0001B4E424|nr:hypothetical protein [Streptomyces himastatinicus]